MKTKLIAGVLLGVAGLSMALAAPRSPGKSKTTKPDAKKDAPAMVQVHVFNKEGKLVGPVESPRVELTPKEWKARLTDEQFQVLRSKGTERPFCGTLLDNKKEGVYTCAGCGLPLFASNSKFNSGTGWPSFFQPVGPKNVVEALDRSHGMIRTEINCGRCDGHLGHVFNDGPPPTGLRYCMNSASLNFTENTELASLADPAAETAEPADEKSGEKSGTAEKTSAKQVKANKPIYTAVFAGGCFWCTEAAFEQLAGVVDAESGYAGGTRETANYEAVCTGRTGHAEAIRIHYNPEQISYEQLLDVFFDAHDPTQLNRQGADKGTQYRSAIFYANDEEKQLAQAKIDQLTAAKTLPRPIVTTLEPLTEFYPAEAYHQNYARNNPLQPYIQGVSTPKVEKVREKYPKMVKPEE